MILCTFLMSQVPEVKEAIKKYSALSGNRREPLLNLLAGRGPS